MVDSNNFRQQPVFSTISLDLFLRLPKLNFKLFGFPYLVGIMKFNLFFPMVIGEVSVTIKFKGSPEHNPRLELPEDRATLRRKGL